jgi:hypothetical protein
MGLTKWRKSVISIKSRQSPVNVLLLVILPGGLTGFPTIPWGHRCTVFQQTYEDLARIWIISQFEVESVKKSWNETDSNQQPGSSIAASCFEVKIHGVIPDQE